MRTVSAKRTDRQGKLLTSPLALYETTPERETMPAEPEP
jgi:hypothetical protein